MSVFKLSNLDLSQIGIQPVVRSTGILSFDIASGVGGFRSGMFVETWGRESSGKTLLAILAAIQAQKDKGEKSILIDGEFAWDPYDSKKISYQLEWFKTLGGNPELFELHYPESSEETYSLIVDDWLPNNKYAYIIIDSWKSMMPKKILEKTLGDKKVGAFGAAALANVEFINQALPKLFRSQTTINCINHEMIDQNVKFGDPRTTGGGRALKYYAKQRINLLTPKNRSVDGVIVDGVFNKNKVASPFRTFRFPISFKTGYDREAVVFSMGLECGVIGGASGSYDFQGTKFPLRGKDNIVNEILRNDPILVQSIESMVREKYVPPVDTSVAEDAGQ